MIISARSVTRQMRRQLDRDNAKQPAMLTPVPEPEWPDAQRCQRPLAVWRSRDYLVQVYAEENGITRLSVARTTMQNNGRWAEGLTWEELQGIKRQVGMGDLFAVEIFPKDKDIINVANLRHLWVLQYPLDFGWKRS